MYVLTFPPRLPNRIQPNFACPLGVEEFCKRYVKFLTPRPYKLMYGLELP